MSENTNTKRIAKNTLMLYFRQILILITNLYTVRVVLNVLGAEDYGIYNVVAGVVTMFSFLSNSMSTASQRFFSYDLGKNDSEHLKQTFSMTVIVYVLLAVVLVIIAETLGLWFFECKIVVPDVRKIAARWVYHFSVISFIFTIITTPYMAVIIAHEKMDIYAIVSIVEVVLKLLIAFLVKIILFDKLIIYAILLFLVTLINTTVYRTICKIKFEECKFKFYWSKDFFSQLMSYVSWNLFGSVATVVRNQGINILLNMFFGPIVNAARGIAFQINNAFMSFAQNFSTAVRPQIIKSYAADDRRYMLNLVIKGTRFIYYLMLMIAVPLYLEMPYVLELWLKNVPEHTVMFSRLVVIDVLIDCISYPIMAVSQATGKIKLYQAVVGGLLILNLPVSYVFLRMGYSAENVFVISIVLSVVALFMRTIIVQRVIKYNLIRSYMMMFLKFVIVTCVAFVLPAYCVKYFNNSFVKLLCFVLICVIWTSFFVVVIDTTKEERLFIINKIKGVKK